MPSERSVFQHSHYATWPIAVAVLAASTIILGIMMAVHLVRGVPIADLTRDVTAVAEVPVHAGFLSQLGISVRMATAAICLFSAVLLKGHGGSRRDPLFLLLSGLFTLWLGLDDAFSLHEDVIPGMGFPQKGVLLGNVLASALIFLVFRRLLAQSDYLLLGMALLFLALSILFDQTTPTFLDSHLLEDGAKLVGILSWGAFYASHGVRVVRASQS